MMEEVEREISCSKRAEDKTGCCGECWLNVAASFDVWEVMSTKCGGSEEEGDMLDEMFHSKRDKKELFDKYKFTEEEKEIIEDAWY